MLKIRTFFLITIGTLFLGCYEGGDIECFDSSHFVSINVFTSKKVDSVDFYINKELKCQLNSPQLYLKEMSDDYYRAESIVSNIEEKNLCDSLEKKQSWYSYHCFLSENRDKININSFEMKAVVYEEDGVNEVKIKKIFSGGNIVNIIPERDTIKWFGFNSCPLIPDSENCKTPALSVRSGCYDGYCVATLPMLKTDYCYDK